MKKTIHIIIDASNGSKDSEIEYHLRRWLLDNFQNGREAKIIIEDIK